MRSGGWVDKARALIRGGLQYKTTSSEHGRGRANHDLEWTRSAGSSRRDWTWCERTHACYAESALPWLVTNYVPPLTSRWTADKKRGDGTV
jgi:hypothetical protein